MANIKKITEHFTPMLGKPEILSNTQGYPIRYIYSNQYTMLHIFKTVPTISQWAKELDPNRWYFFAQIKEGEEVRRSSYIEVPPTLHAAIAIIEGAIRIKDGGIAA